MMQMDKIFLSFKKRFIKDIPVLAYHRIVNIENEDEYPFDEALVSASEQEFNWQMQYISENFTPIRLSEVCEFVLSGKRLPKNPIIVTFDDGFDDNYYTAFPILKKHNVPATIFVVPEFIDSHETIWYEKLAYLIKNTTDDVEIPGLNLILKGTDDLVQRRNNYCTVVNKLKVVSNADRLIILDDLYARYLNDFSQISESVRALSRSLSWEQIQEMNQSIVEIGSHSVTHPVLTMLTDDELAHELSDSKKILEDKLNEPVSTVAYPVGMEFAYDQRVKNATRHAGYTIGLSYIPGRNDPAKLDQYGIRRFHVDRDMPRTFFSSMLAFRTLFVD
jgi:peptidoglycan/xylan/chitin deacetylase (PgdA/CDA1 family)